MRYTRGLVHLRWRMKGAGRIPGRPGMKFGPLVAIGFVMSGCGPSKGGGVDGGGGVSGSAGAIGTGGVGAGAGGDGAGAGGVGGGAGGVGGGGIGGRGGVAGSGTAGAVGAGGLGGLGSGGTGSGGNLAMDPDLVLLYTFDEASGSTAADTSGFAGGPRNGTLMTVGTGTATFSATHQVGTHALQLMGDATNGGFVAIPSLESLAPDTVTLAAWVNMPPPKSTSAPDIFSFSSDSSHYLSMTVDLTRMTTSFQIVAPVLSTQRIQSTAAISTNTWHHLAVVLGPYSIYTSTIYLDGVAVATNGTMGLHASDVGATTANYIGRAVLTTSMVYFTGLIDDFRIYRRALTQSEISTLYGLR